MFPRVSSRLPPARSPPAGISRSTGRSADTQLQTPRCSRWLSGDKTYLELRSDGSLAALYAIQPDNRPASVALSTAVLDQRLARASGVAIAELRALQHGFLWIRAQDLDSGAQNDVLSLAYCATQRSDRGWEAWCVDAATGHRERTRARRRLTVVPATAGQREACRRPLSAGSVAAERSCRKRDPALGRPELPPAPIRMRSGAAS